MTDYFKDSEPKLVWIHHSVYGNFLIDEKSNFYRLEKLEYGMSGDFIRGSPVYLKRERWISGQHD